MLDAPGNIGFCHSTGIISRAIRLGERLRFRAGDFWNHVFIISDEVDANGEPLVIQAIGRGVDGSKPLSTVAPGGRYEIVPLSPDVDASRVLEFAKGEVGTEYAWLAVIWTALRIVLPRWLPLPYLRTGSTWYCSSLAAESARCGGWVHRWPDVYSVVPSELYAALTGVSLSDLRVPANWR